MAPTSPTTTGIEHWFTRDSRGWRIRGSMVATATHHRLYILRILPRSGKRFRCKDRVRSMVRGISTIERAGADGQVVEQGEGAILARRASAGEALQIPIGRPLGADGIEQTHVSDPLG